MKCFVIFFFIGLTVSSLAQTTWDEPWFCHDIDCPVYTSVENTTVYEIRKYDVSYWVSTLVEDISLDSALDTGFDRLFNYISGQNSQNEEIPMTAPVRAVIQPGAGPNCDSNFTVSFFVPFAYQTNTPQPTNPLVFLEEDNSIEVAVISFGGEAHDEVVVAKAHGLADALDKDGVSYEAEPYFFAGYDPPYRIRNRHNEVWFQLN
eukprot:CAMPEP_0168557244 /NCGR_PEP_ID=MMETSP0413-20121227/9321_1 /TAXON_ID=136452 /ORGANISM="Filamoeba nolandi, Strain NC-AS-23-1" /LENGTH=204 /DNA_ID=CAMNT_0008588261 /DNA_START=10 /DNA_END=624 /DNA_ORIENTATION=-